MSRRIANKHMVLLDEDLSEAITERYSVLKKHVEETFDRDSQIKVGWIGTDLTQ